MKTCSDQCPCPGTLPKSVLRQQQKAMFTLAGRKLTCDQALFFVVVVLQVGQKSEQGLK